MVTAEIVIDSEDLPREDARVELKLQRVEYLAINVLVAQRVAASGRSSFGIG